MIILHYNSISGSFENNSLPQEGRREETKRHDKRVAEINEEPCATYQRAIAGEHIEPSIRIFIVFA